VALLVTSVNDFVAGAKSAIPIALLFLLLLLLLLLRLLLLLLVYNAMVIGLLFVESWADDTLGMPVSTYG